MQSFLSLRDLWRQIKRMIWIWLGLAVFAALIVLLIQGSVAKEQRATVATVSYSYDGIESGHDPSGNQLDPFDIKDADIIVSAGNRVGLTLTEEQIESIQKAIVIEGIAPGNALAQFTEYESIYTGDSLSSHIEVQGDSYFPSRYVVSLRYTEIGLSQEDALNLLNAILETYIENFHKLFGYNSQVEQCVRGIDYNEYDYSRSVEVLDTSLLSLRNYINTLATQDNTRFVSKNTGYSFSDIVGAIDVIRSEDITWLTSYIDSNNITRYRKGLIDYYSYRIENYNRDLAVDQARLATLDDLIANYTKTEALILGLGDTNPYTGAQSSYSISQPSEMYDALIAQRIDCQTDIASVQERISYYQTRIERLSASGSSGRSSLVEERLQQIDDKLQALISDSAATAREYYETVKLDGAVQILEIRDNASTALPSLIRNGFAGILICEAILFGAFLMISIILALRPASNDSAKPDGGASERKMRKKKITFQKKSVKEG